MLALGNAKAVEGRWEKVGEGGERWGKVGVEFSGGPHLQRAAPPLHLGSHFPPVSSVVPQPGPNYNCHYATVVEALHRHHLQGAYRPQKQ